MSNLIHSLSLTEFKLCLVLNYTIVWYFLYNAMGLISSKKAFQLKLIAVLFYTTIPVFLAVTLAQQGFSRTAMITSTQVHLLLIIVAYYLFSTIEELRIKERYNVSIILHHVGFGTMLFLVAVSTDIPAYGLWAVAVQFSAIFVSIRSVLKAAPALYAKFNPLLEECDFIVFFHSRVIFQTLIMFVAVVEMDCGGVSYIAISMGTLLAMSLNLFWFKQILMRRANVKKNVFAA